MTQDVHSGLADVLAGGEGNAVEFKRSLTKDVGRGLCAFANAGGGTVLLGVSDAGKAVGVADHNRLKSRVLSPARSADPPIEVEVESVGDVLRAIVPPLKRKPCSFGGRFFMREEATSRQMPNAEVEELFYAAGGLHFDRKPCPDFSIENDLDDETWARFSRRAKVPESMDRMVALRNLGLLDNDSRMTHAGAWLLAHDIRSFETSASSGPESTDQGLELAGAGLESAGAGLESAGAGLESSRSGQESLERRVLVLLAARPLSRSAIADGLGRRSVSAGLNRVIHRLLKDGRAEYTVPNKPNSRLQKYRITQAGHAALEEPGK